MREDERKLRERLDKIEWPELYMFKFIFEPNGRREAMLRNMFDNQSRVTLRASSNGKYVSFTAVEMMMSSDSVIERYHLVGEIEGITAL